MIPLILSYSLAANNDRGLGVRNTDFAFSPSGATNLYWGLTLLFAAILVFMIFNMVKALIAPETLSRLMITGTWMYFGVFFWIVGVIVLGVLVLCTRPK